MMLTREPLFVDKTYLCKAPIMYHGAEFVEVVLASDIEQENAALRARLNQAEGVIMMREATLEQERQDRNGLLAKVEELERWNHPICLVCGADKPCMTEEEANKHGASQPCTFDMTPRQVFDYAKQQKAKVAALEKARQEELDAYLVDLKQVRDQNHQLVKALKRAVADPDGEHDEWLGAAQHTLQQIEGKL